MRLTSPALVACLMLAGCGGDGGGGSEDTLSPAEWSGRVEQLCEENANRAEAKVVELRDQARKENLSQQEFAARVLDASVELTEPMLDRVDAIPPPEGREEDAKRFTGSIRDAMAQIGDAADAIRDNDEQAAQEANDKVLEIAVESRKLARDLDVEACIPQQNAGG
jgi:hypothetical protein